MTEPSSNNKLIKLFLKATAHVLDQQMRFGENLKLFCASCIENSDDVHHGCQNFVYVREEWRFDKGVEKLAKDWYLRKQVFAQMHLFYGVINYIIVLRCSYNIIIICCWLSIIDNVFRLQLKFDLRKFFIFSVVEMMGKHLILLTNY